MVWQWASSGRRLTQKFSVYFARTCERAGGRVPVTHVDVNLEITQGTDVRKNVTNQLLLTQAYGLHLAHSHSGSEGLADIKRETPDPEVLVVLLQDLRACRWKSSSHTRRCKSGNHTGPRFQKERDHTTFVDSGGLSMQCLLPIATLFQRGRSPFWFAVIMPPSRHQVAKRALVSILLLLSRTYGLAVGIKRETPDPEVLRVLRQDLRACRWKSSSHTRRCKSRNHTAA